MSKPFFSIIIPTLNEEKYLPKLLEDLSHQTFKDFEVIVVDARSKDKTVARAKSYLNLLPSLHILTSEKRHVCIERNLGADHAKSDLLIFSDADNRLPSYFLQGIKYRLESTPCDIAYTWIAPEKNTPQYKVIASAINLYYDAEVALLKSPAGMESMIIVKKDIFYQAGMFDTNINLGEGRYLAQAIEKIGGIPAIFKDPQYTYSLRRLQRFGTIRTASAVARSEILALLSMPSPQKDLFPKLYPMLGGGVYDQRVKLNKRKLPKFLKNIQKILREL
ncbi:MAG: glycosyltransferase [bacterium]